MGMRLSGMTGSLRWRGVAAGLCLSLAVGLGACAAPPSVTVAAPEDAGLRATGLLDEIRTLTSPEMAGRSAGTPGADRAARHIAEVFRQAGLRPGGEDGYFQWFEVVTGVRLGEPNRLRIQRDDRRLEYSAGDAFVPIRFSASGRVAGEVVFAGYGITAPDLGYDDYAGLDVRERIVLVLTHEPRERDEASPFRRPEAFHYGELRHKAINAREHGARAVIVVTDELHHPDESLPPLRGSGAAEWGILAVHASRRVGSALLAGSGTSLRQLQQAIDAGLAPHSRPLPGVTVELEVRLVQERGRTANVIGILPGRDPAVGSEAVVVGGHYDHLGIGNEASLTPERIGEIHPGADDNASGTATVLALAGAFARAGGTPRTLVFVAFAAEEVGLLGSTRYVQAPPIPLERTVAMLNFDSVGRMQGNRLHIMGVESARELRGLVAEVGVEVGLELRLTGDAVGSSDHTAFFLRDLPVLFFFTGPHEDYHRPSDTWEKINAEGLHRVAVAAYRIIGRLADGRLRLTFVKAAGPPAARSRDRVAGGYGPYFGSVPDFTESAVPGARLGGVRPGSPADRAGLKAGDVIVKFGGKTVNNLDDFVFALRGRRAGDLVEVIYLRDGTAHATRATLEERR